LMNTLFTDAIHALLADLCSGPQLRALHRGEGTAAPWQALVDSGFLNALLPESAGGVGLSVADCVPVMMAAGYHALPLPFVDTMVLRAVLGHADAPQERALALARPDAAGRASALLFQAALQGVDAVVILDDTGSRLQSVLARHSDDASLLQLSGPEQKLSQAPDPLLLGAFVELVQMAGCMQRLLEMTAAYAGEREQFGRPVGKFQAIQQQLSVMTGHCHSAVMAAHVAAAGTTVTDGCLVLDPERVAAGRTVVCEAAQPVSDIAHAVHGAIGITEEYDLQLWTQRLLQGRRSYGAESFWAARLGASCLASDQPLYPLVQARLAP